MKTEITEQERKDMSLKSIIDKMSLECNETLDFMKEQRGEFCNASEESQEMYMHGFAEALDYCNSMISELRKPSESETSNDFMQKLRDYFEDTPGEEVIRAWDSTKEFDSEPIGRTDEELVQKIESVMVCFSRSDGFHYMLEDPYTEVATEIAALIPSSRCQENDVNMELLEALRLIRDDINAGEPASESFLEHINVIADSAISNAEKQTNP